MTEECEQVRIDEQAFARAADLIAHDLTATLGWETGKAQAEARDALENRAGLLPTGPAWDDFDRVTQRELLDEVVVAAVEVVQQFLHDTFVIPPGRRACAIRTIPCGSGKVRAAAASGACPRDEAEIAPLGMLPGPASPPDRHP